jgi:hypothetical protein
VGRWHQNGSYGVWLGGCGLDSTVSGQGPVAGCCECGDEPSGSCATELVSYILLAARAYKSMHITTTFNIVYFPSHVNLTYIFVQYY